MPSPKKCASRSKKHPSRSKRHKKKSYRGDREDSDELPGFYHFHISKTQRIKAKINETSTPETILESMYKSRKFERDSDYTIVFVHELLAFERTLEYRENFWPIWVKFGKSQAIKFLLIRDPTRYEHLKNAKQFFPPNMIALDETDFRNVPETPNIVRQIDMQYMLWNTDKVPIVFEELSMRDMGGDVWYTNFVVLKDGVMYCSKSVTMNTSAMNKLLEIKDFDVYFVKNGRSNYQARWNYNFALKKRLLDEDQDCEEEDEEDEYDEADYLMFSCKTPEARICWITAMRLMKYGKDIRGEYPAYETTKLYSAQERCTESERTKQAIGYSDYVSIRRRRRVQLHPEVNERLGGQLPEPQEPKSPLVLPFYIPQARAHAIDQLLRLHKNLDGVCMIRDAGDRFTKFVLSYTVIKDKSTRIFHAQIKQVDISGKLIPELEPQVPVYLTIGNPHPLFFDLLQLVEYYTLNAELATKLTHFVDQNGDLYTTDLKKVPRP